MTSSKFSEVSLLSPTEERELCKHEFETNMDNPTFFREIAIADDCGFSEVEEMYKTLSWGMYLQALLAPCLILYNLVYLVVTDIRFLAKPQTEMDRMYMLSTSLVLEPMGNGVARLLGYDHFEVRAQQMFAVLEITGMALGLLFISWTLASLTWLPAWKKWMAVYNLYWCYLPHLSTYSLMSFLGPVTPFVVMSDFEEQIASLVRDGAISAKDLGVLVRFVLVRVFYAIIGFDAFLVKFRLAASYVTKDSVALWEVLGAANFIIQLVGVVQVSRLVQRRLFVFMFAGEDCILDKRDEIRMDMYNALLAKKIYSVTNSWVDFSVVMVNFNDYDFQKLVLNTRRRSPRPTIDKESDGAATSMWRWPWSKVPAAHAAGDEGKAEGAQPEKVP